MEMFINYLLVFAIGGLVCVIGQCIMNLTKLTSARILVIFLLIGIVLESVGIFDTIKEVAQAGITTPITGFGSVLAKGAIEGAKNEGLLGALTGGVKAGGVGIGVAVFVGFIVALLSKSRTK